MAFIIVQHLSPDFKSLMEELLARHTLLPIHLVEDGMPVEADHVYLIPAKKEMIVSGSRLRLSDRDRQQEMTLPIDMFFRSLAQDCGSRAIAIVLSGGGTTARGEFATCTRQVVFCSPRISRARSLTGCRELPSRRASSITPSRHRICRGCCSSAIAIETRRHRSRSNNPSHASAIRIAKAKSSRASGTPRRRRSGACASRRSTRRKHMLDRWDTRWADTRIHGTTKRQVAEMFAEERPALGPLPLEPFRYYRFGVRTEPDSIRL